MGRAFPSGTPARDRIVGPSIQRSARPRGTTRERLRYNLRVLALPTLASVALSLTAPMGATVIERFDRAALHWINCDLQGPVLQRVLFTLQDKFVGVPLVLLLIIWIAWRRGRRVALRTFVTCLLTYLVCWGVASAMWATIGRPRPPRTAGVLVLRTPAERATCAAHPDSVSLRMYVSHRPGFPSQHALNAAAFAMAIFLAMRVLGCFAIVYALIVGVARVYTAAHWPTDVLAGLALGAVIGWCVWRSVPRLLGLVHRRAWVEAEPYDVSQGP